MLAVLRLLTGGGGDEKTGPALSRYTSTYGAPVGRTATVVGNMDRERWWAVALVVLAMLATQIPTFSGWARWGVVGILALLALWAFVRSMRASELEGVRRRHQEQLRVLSVALNLSLKVAELANYSHGAIPPLTGTRSYKWRADPADAKSETTGAPRLDTAEQQYILDVEEALKALDSVLRQVDAAIGARYSYIAAEIRATVRAGQTLREVADSLAAPYRRLVYLVEKEFGAIH